MRRGRLDIKDLTLCALFAALLAVGTFVRIPTPLLPLTLQTLFVVLAGLVLGARRGALSVAVYVTLGLAGAPVFTQGGGLGYVLHPTFGYILAFIPGAWLAGRIAERMSPCMGSWILAGLSAIALIYAVGIPWYACVSRWALGRSLSADVLIWTFVIMPLPGDVASCVVAAIATRRLRALLPDRSDARET